MPNPPIPNIPGLDLRPITPTDPQDLAQVLEVYRQCEDFLALGPVSTASLSMVEADLALSARAGSIYMGVHAGPGRLAAIIDFLPGGYAGDPRRAYLALVMIAQPDRRTGLGSRLLLGLESWLRERGCTGFSAHVQVNNPASLAFFCAHGFAIIGPPRLQDDSTTSVELFKRI